MGSWRNVTQNIFLNTLYILLLPLLAVFCLAMPKSRDLLIWGPDPIINNKYWSEAMKEVGHASQTVMKGYYTINKKEDFDVYYGDLVPGGIFLKPLRGALEPFFAFIHMVKRAKVVHLPFSGGPLENTPLARLEASLFRWAGIKTVLIPYGSDVYM